MTSEQFEAYKLNDGDTFFLETHWRNIEEWFEWEKVQIVMSYLEWEWQNKGIPSIQQLKDTVKSLMIQRLKGVIVGGNYDFRRGIGGFIVDFDKGAAMFEIYFSIAAWDTEHIHYEISQN